MSVLEDLINKHCPDGVEYVPLWSVTIWDKKFNSVDRKKQSEVINYPYLLASDLFAMEQDNGDVFLLSTGEKTGWTTEKIAGNNLCNGEVVTIPWGKSRAVIDCIKYYKGKFVTADNRIMTSNDKNKLNNKFLYYIIMSKGKLIDTFYRGSGIKHPDMSRVLDIIIPLPPIEVQKEIVRILDEFTLKTAELQELLHKEYISRKKQYEYYRNKLLTFRNDKSQWKRLGDIAHIVMGQSPDSKSYNKNNIGLPFLQGCATFGTVYPLINTYSSDIKKIAVNGSILMSVRAPVGKLNIANTDICIGRGLCSINSNCEVSNKYIFYSLKNSIKYISDKYKGAIFDSITSDGIRNLKIPVPPLEEQERIVKILDRFDALCNDISSGLPAEIEMRKKQYEYYRDKLLTFKEKKV